MKTVTTEEIEYDPQGNVVKRTITTETVPDIPNGFPAVPPNGIQPWRTWPGKTYIGDPPYRSPYIWTTNHPDGCYVPRLYS